MNRKTRGKLQARAHTRRAAAQSCDALTTLSHKPSPAPSPCTMQAMHCVIFYLISVPLHRRHYPFDSVVLSLNCRFCRPFSNLTLNSLSLCSRRTTSSSRHPPPPPIPWWVGRAASHPPPGEQMDTAAADAIVVLLQPLPYIYIHIVLLDKFLSEPLASPWLTSA